MSTVAPYRGVVSITKSGTTKTFNPFTPTYDFNLIQGRITQGYGGVSSRLTLLIEDSNAALYSFFQPGGTYTIQWGKSAGSLSTLTNGFVERRVVKRPNMDTMLYELTCFDVNTILDWRIANVNRFQKRLSSGNLDSSDTTMDIGNLAKFLAGYNPDGSANSDAYYPMNQLTNVKTLAVEHGITVGGVELADERLPTFNAEYQTIRSILKQLTENGGDWVAYIDENDDLKFKAQSSSDSGILVTDSESPSWPDPAKVAHIIDDTELQIEQTLEDMKNLIIGVGGSMETPAYTQTSVAGGSDTLYDKYIAFKLPRIKDTGVTAVAVRMSRTGQPDIDLFGEIREDNGNTPQGGAFVKGFQIGKTAIGTSNEWALGDLIADINTQVDHWLILYKDNGTTGSSSKTYNWHHDGGATGTRATSTDGVTWTVTGSTKQYGFLLWTDARIISLSFDADSISQYKQRDMVLSDTGIKTVLAMSRRLNPLLNQLKVPKEVVTATLFPPDTIIPVGKTVTIRESKTGIDGSYRVLQADYLLDSVGALSMEIQAQKTQLD